MAPKPEEQEVTISEATYEELEALELQFEDAELDILRAATKRFAPLYAKRNEMIAKIDHFWAIVIEQGPPEVDQHIQPSDSQLIADALTNIDVDRFEIDDAEGSPRSFSITFTFADDNEYFTNKTLTKKFWYRRSNDDWVGLVSEPVKIDWKEGKDLTKGLNAAVVKLWEARAKAAKGRKESELPEFKALVKLIEDVAGSDAAESFFAWFSYVSPTRWVSAEESKEANKKEDERRAKLLKGEKTEEKDDEEEMRDADDLEYDILSQIHPEGDDLAISIAEELWPKATEYFTGMNQWDDDDISEMDEDEDDSEGEEVDIRALVGKGSAAPSKKKK